VLAVRFLVPAAVEIMGAFSLSMALAISTLALAPKEPSVDELLRE
jgi:hypothetical protein